MPPIDQTDDVLLYGLARYFGFGRRERRTTGGVMIVSLLLALYRAKHPMRRDEIVKLVGMGGHNTPNTFRVYAHHLRNALGGPGIIYMDAKFNYSLSEEGRVMVEDAFEFIQNELAESIKPREEPTAVKREAA